MRKTKKKKRLRAVLILLIILFILAGLGGMLYVSHRDKVEKEQRREAALAALDSIPEVTATPAATATPVPTATPTPSLTPVPTILPAFEPENYQGIWYSEDGLTTIDIYDISLKSVSFTYKRVNGKDPSMTAEADVTAEVAGNATQFRFKDSEGNKAKGEFVFDKSGELYVKVKTYERGDGSLTYPKTESIMTRQEPSWKYPKIPKKMLPIMEATKIPMNRNPTAKAVKILLMRIQKNMRFPTEKKKPIIRNDQKNKTR